MKTKSPYRIKKTAWDNWYGYIGRFKAIAFSNSSTQTQEQAAKHWLETKNKKWEASQNEL